jgi:glycosyltransferase involved in cell wall biosynthesis
VDDASTDGTRELLEKLAGAVEAGESQFALQADDDPLDVGNIRVFFQERNRGKGAALRRGFAEAAGDVVIIQDADLEYNPADYGKLLEPIRDNVADVVYGSRFLGGPHRVLYFHHYMGNTFLTLLSNALTNLNLTDMETGYKVFRREVLRRITIQQNRFGFEPEITAKVARMGCRIYEVPISYYGRTYAEGKKIGWKDGLQAVYCILRYNLLP